MTDVTQILSQIEDGDPSAAEQLLPLVYEELRKLAAAKLAKEKPGQTLASDGAGPRRLHPAGGRREGPALEQPWPLLWGSRQGDAEDLG